MTRQHKNMFGLIVIVALILGYAGFANQHLQAQAQPKAARTAVAVVNFSVLINKCQKNLDFQAEINKRDAKFRQEASERKNKIDLLRQDLDLVGSAAERKKKEREITKALYEFQAWNRIENENLLRDQHTTVIELYGDIDQAVTAIAQQEGYDIVLFDTPPLDFDTLKPNQLLQAIGDRRLLYHSEKVDLTPIVLEKLNLDYLNRGGN